MTTRTFVDSFTNFQGYFCTQFTSQVAQSSQNMRLVDEIQIQIVGYKIQAIWIKSKTLAHIFTCLLISPHEQRGFLMGKAHFLSCYNTAVCEFLATGCLRGGLQVCSRKGSFNGNCGIHTSLDYLSPLFPAFLNLISQPPFL